MSRIGMVSGMGGVEGSRPRGVMGGGTIGGVGSGGS